MGGLADFYNARSPREIVFGPNMTTLTFMMTRVLGPQFREGDEQYDVWLRASLSRRPQPSHGSGQRGCRVATRHVNPMRSHTKRRARQQASRPDKAWARRALTDQYATRFVARRSRSALQVRCKTLSGVCSQNWFAVGAPTAREVQT